MSQIAVESSTLASVSYSPDRRWLELRFRNGRVYRYFEVPLQCYRALLEADSKGAYFNRSIRNRFPFQHVPAVDCPSPTSGLREN